MQSVIPAVNHWALRSFSVAKSPYDMFLHGLTATWSGKLSVNIFSLKNCNENSLMTLNIALNSY